MLVLPAVCLAAAGVCPTPAAEPAHEQQFLEGLINRRLFTLAELHCQEQLRRDDLDPRTRVELQVDLARVGAERALDAPPDAREPLWRRTRQLLTEARERTPDDSLRVLPARQDALLHLARGIQARQESEVVARREPLQEQAREELRTAIRLLEQQESEVQRLLVLRRSGGRLPEAALDEDELHALVRDLQFQQARALQQQALTYPESGRDRRLALARAAERFQPLADRPRPPDWRSLLGLARNYRLDRQFSEAARLLRSIEQRMEQAVRVPPEVASETRLEQARLESARGRVAQAIQLLERGPDGGNRHAAEWDYELLAALLQAWQQADDGDEAARLQARAADQVRHIESRHAPYWRRRAEMLLGSAVAAGPPTEDLEVLLRAAQGYYRSDRLDDALDAYRRARRQAAEGGLPERALEIGLTLAAIEYRRERFAEAAALYRQLALEGKTDPRAAETHRMAAVAKAESLRARQAPDLSGYRDLLREHLEHWPDAATAPQVKLWLGRLLQQQRQWEQAVAVLGEVDPQSEQYAGAVERTAACYRGWLAERAAAGESTRALGTEAAAHFEALVTAGGTRWPERFSAVERAAALHAAEFHLRYARADYDRAEALLRAALARAGEAEPEWRAAAEILLVHALAAQPGKRSEAEQVLRQVALDEAGAAGRSALLALSDALAGLAAADPAADESAALQLAAVQRLLPLREQLAPQQRRALDLAHAESQRRAGSREEARAAYARLAAAYPDDGPIQVAYAELLLESDDPDDWRAALEKWREVERRTPAAEPRWFQAKLSQAVAHQRLGNCRQAVRIVSLTRLLHRELGGPELRRQFEAVLARCGES